jgi:2-polyprenyl-6-methoxyphenol hydroxylase-like FAD-dependent oxidoreductase
MMRKRAIDAGARFVCARVARLANSGGQWELKTQDGTIYACDFLVGADGATSKLRPKFGVEFKPKDFIYGLGWHIKTDNAADWYIPPLNNRYTWIRK